MQIVEITIQPGKEKNHEEIRSAVARKLKCSPESIQAIRTEKRSLDARGQNPVYLLRVGVWFNNETLPLPEKFEYPDVSKAQPCIIIGMGPAGLFAALELMKHGYKPVIIERGKAVRGRRRDLRDIMLNNIVNEDSNYCFGEGGAGTFSDGKLYTRSTKRGSVKDILDTLYRFGAVEDILVDAHPHIGSNKLPKIIENMRETILNKGGEILFETRVTDLIISGGKCRGVVINDNTELLANAVIVATGHSARDIYTMFHSTGLLLERKDFAVGVRIEHPQQLINETQYRSSKNRDILPAAKYSITCQVEARGVFSFCMCPGGIVIPASTSQNELVLNGMSVSKRNSPFANSGFVAAVGGHQVAPFEHAGIFAGMEYQKHLEQVCHNFTGNTQRAPAQRATDFVRKKVSSTLPHSSYIPGLVSAPLHTILPAELVAALQGALVQADKKMKGFLTEDALLLAPETRTSSPVRIPRHPDTLQHPQAEGLFPCGEGAGYAGGIVSAAIDGVNCALAATGCLH